MPAEKALVEREIPLALIVKLQRSSLLAAPRIEPLQPSTAAAALC